MHRNRRMVMDALGNENFFILLALSWDVFKSAAFCELSLTNFLRSRERWMDRCRSTWFRLLSTCWSFFLKCWKYFYLLKVRVRLEHKNSRIRRVESWRWITLYVSCTCLVRVWSLRFVLSGIVSNSIMCL